MHSAHFTPHYAARDVNYCNDGVVQTT